MYGIFIACCYAKVNGWEYQTEQYHSLEFESLEDACSHLGLHNEKILNEYPVDSIEIKLIKP